MLLWNGKHVHLTGEPRLVRQFDVSQDPDSGLKIRGWRLVQMQDIKLVKTGETKTVPLADIYEPSEPSNAPQAKVGPRRSIAVYDEG